MQFRSMQTSEHFINFRDGEDFFELLVIIYKSWLCIIVKVNVYRLGKTWRVRSGQGTWTQPDPTRQCLDPTRPAVLVHIPDPTRPNPTRPDPRVDPTREQLCVNGPE